ncbi:MAG: hypothetical protein ACQEWI_06205 [Bacillota bacterium]
MILLHVLSGIIGVGPTFFAHVLTRPDKTIDQLKVTTELNKRLEYFPKIGGSIAVLTGFIPLYTGTTADLLSCGFWGLSYFRFSFKSLSSASSHLFLKKSTNG